MNLLGQVLATALFLFSQEKTTLRDLPSPSDTSNIVPLPCINIIQARSCQRILPCVWTVGTPYSLDLTSKARPEMTTEYMVLSFPLDNMTRCPAFPTKYLENDLILLCRRLWGAVRVRAYNKVKHFASYITARRIWVQIGSIFLYLDVQMTERATLENRVFFLSNDPFNRSL